MFNGLNRSRHIQGLLPKTGKHHVLCGRYIEGLLDKWLQSRFGIIDLLLDSTGIFYDQAKCQDERRCSRLSHLRNEWDPVEIAEDSTEFCF